MPTLIDLRPWQRQAVGILAKNPFHLLGAQPGAGKTIVTLTAMVARPARSLLIAPAVILDTVWPVEAQRWGHTSHLVFTLAHRKSGGERTALWMSAAGDIVTCTPDTLPKLLEAVRETLRLPFERIVVDESQLFKNPTAVRTAALHALAEHVPTWLLSGTPTPNGVIDCWSPGRIASHQGKFWQ
jgi:SNF2 family DNA or RNA helicase